MAGVEKELFLIYIFAISPKVCCERFIVKKILLPAILLLFAVIGIQASFSRDAAPSVDSALCAVLTTPADPGNPDDFSLEPVDGERSRAAAEFASRPFDFTAVASFSGRGSGIGRVLFARFAEVPPGFYRPLKSAGRSGSGSVSDIAPQILVWLSACVEVRAGPLA